MMLEVQRLASGIVARVLSGRSLDAELLAALSSAEGWSPQDRAALRDIAYGTIRFLGTLDAVLDHLLTRPLKDEPVRNLLRVALYQLAHTRAAPHAIVDHAVRACALLQPAAKSLVNGVLRSFLRGRDSAWAAANRTEPGRYSHPQWWIDKLRAQYPQHHGGILEHANHRPPLTLRVNRRRAAVEDFVNRLAQAGIAASVLGDCAVRVERPLAVERIPGFAEGEFSVQDAAAQHAALLLDAGPGERVLDACAAPGGKTGHILELADVELTALDIDNARLARVRANLDRLRLAAAVSCGDAARPETWWDGTPYSRILADVPCSASGVVRRHPDIKWLRRPEDIDRFAQRQREILEALWRLLASNGKLLYATCSVFVEENNQQIERFLERHPDAQRLTLPRSHTKAELLAGQILPDETHDGFFYALLQKS